MKHSKLRSLITAAICIFLIENTTASTTATAQSALSSPPHNEDDPFDTPIDKSASDEDQLTLITMELSALALEAWAPTVDHNSDNGKNKGLLQKHQQDLVNNIAQMQAEYPDSPCTFFVRGMAKKYNKDSSAFEEYQRAVTLATTRIENHPDHLQNYIIRAESYKELGRKDLAILDYHEALKHTKDEHKIAVIRAAMARLGGVP